jgi:tetrapyrrole methylase family protein/MazG family protein
MSKPFDKLTKITHRLRNPKTGCPWDRVQTHKSLKPYLIEEAYEALEAIDEKDYNKLCGELGDVLLQVILHAEMAKQKGKFDINDVIKGITDKMIRRHPHVFKSKIPIPKSQKDKIEKIWKKWEQIKKGEEGVKGEKESILKSVPKSLPALYRAEKVQKKAARVGFDWDRVAGAWQKVYEETDEINQILNKSSQPKGILKTRLEEELGDLLFAIANVARKLDVSAEEALHSAINKFSQRFKYLEDHARRSKKELHEMGLEEMESLWKRVKKNVKTVF